MAAGHAKICSLRSSILICILALSVDLLFLKLKLRNDYNSDRFKIAPEGTCTINQPTYCCHGWKSSHRGKRFLSVKVPFVLRMIINQY